MRNRTSKLAAALWIGIGGSSLASLGASFPGVAQGLETSRLEPLGADGEGRVVTINGKGQTDAPQTIAEIDFHAVPNPFNPAMGLRFDLPEDGRVADNAHKLSLIK